MATQMDSAWSNIFSQRDHYAKLYDEVNRVERATCRNNIQIVNYPEAESENIRAIVDDIFITKFGFDKVRDRIEVVFKGRATPRPRHILIKLLRYTDKVIFMRSWRQCLNDESYKIVDDLTNKIDLEEKKRWTQ